MTSAHGVSVTMPCGPGAYLVRLSGVISEDMALPSSLSRLSGVVVFDLDEVDGITSFGIRDWLHALRGMKATYYAFTRCRPPVLRQFDMIHGFAVQGELVSFYLPYECNACEEVFEVLVDLRYELVRPAEQSLTHRCISCGSDAVLDEGDDYLEFPASQPRPSVPPLAQQLIDGKTAANVDRLKLTKELRGEVTVLRLHGILSEGAKLRRWTHGLEGPVQVDLTGVRSATPAAVQELSDAVPHPPRGRTTYDGVRLDIAHALREVGRKGETAIRSVLLAGRCLQCATEVEVQVSAESGSKMPCPQCGIDQAIEVPAERKAQADLYLQSCDEEENLPETGQGGQSRPQSAKPRVEPNLATFDGRTLVAKSPAFRNVVELAESVAGVETTVLLRGETGTGKEMLARYIHTRSPRHDKPFVAVNCAALPEGVIESELFGHEPGAFTGATSRNLGRFERANGGTLFIDDVGDLPPTVQVKLLRTMQERYIERVGGKTVIPIDICLIAATHRDLESMIQKETFREDLYYRLNVVPLTIPPLRERRDDILPLAELYLREAQARSGKYGMQIGDAMRGALLRHTWPGNIRELVNVVERAVALNPSGKTLELTDFVEEARGAEVAADASIPDGGLKGAMDSYERTLIRRALQEAGGNRTEAARLLGLSRQSLRQKMTKHRL